VIKLKISKNQKSERKNASAKSPPAGDLRGFVIRNFKKDE
jgi:hypothetical protein